MKRIFFLLLLATLVIPLPSQAAFKISAPLITAKTGLVGHWTFDKKDTDFNAATTLEKSGSGTSGTLNGSISASALTGGKVAQALTFDGSNDYVKVTHSARLINPYMSISLWMRPNVTYDSGTDIVSLADKNNTGIVDYVMNLRGSGGTGEAEFVAGINGELKRVSSATTQWNAGEWYHLVGTYDGTTMRIYVNGVQDGTTSISGTISAGSNPLIIGAVSTENGRFFNGTIDDLRIYNRALTAAEVKTLSKQRETIEINTLPFSGPLTSGLIGYWTFDGKNTNWSSETAGTALDISSSGNSGTITNMSRSFSPSAGKIGQGLRFDGSNDYVNVGNPAALQFTGGTHSFTLSAWIKKDGDKNNNSIMVKQGTSGNFGYMITASANKKPLFRMCKNSVACSDVEGTPELSNNIWYHVSATYTASNNRMDLYVNGVSVGTGTYTQGAITSNSSFYIGNDSDNSSARAFKGTIDDVRVYNKALTATEIMSLYRQSASVKQNTSNSPIGTSGLVGHWTMDGRHVNWGTNALTDASGSGNTGTLTNVAASTDAVIGKIGQALRFNGTSSYVDFGDTLDPGTNSISSSLWINLKSGSFAEYTGVLSKGGHDTNAVPCLSYIGEVATRNVIIGDQDDTPETLSATVALNAGWNHLVCVRDTTNKTFTVYKNGAQAYSASYTTTGNAGNARKLLLGAQHSLGFTPNIQRYLGGATDDLRIYNRALSAAEVKSLYSMGR